MSASLLVGTDARGVSAVGLDLAATAVERLSNGGSDLIKRLLN